MRDAVKALKRLDESMTPDWYTSSDDGVDGWTATVNEPSSEQVAFMRDGSAESERLAAGIAKNRNALPKVVALIEALEAQAGINLMPGKRQAAIRRQKASDRVNQARAALLAALEDE